MSHIPDCTKRAKSCSSCKNRKVTCLRQTERQSTCLRGMDSKRSRVGRRGYRAILHWRPVKGPLHFSKAERFDRSGPEREAHRKTSISSQYPQRVQQKSTMANHMPVFRLSQDTNLQLPAMLTCTESQDLQFPLPDRDATFTQSKSHQSYQTYRTHSRSDAITKSSLRDRPPSRLMLSEKVTFYVPKHNSSEIEKRHVDALPKMHLQRRLMEYWVNYLSDALAPVPGLRNPLKTIFVPIACLGAHTPAQESNTSVALFYFVCAAASFHLSQFTETLEDRPSFMQLALENHSRALNHLQHNLAVDDPSQQESVLACLLMCLYYEPVTTDATFWRKHFQGAFSWLRRTDANKFIQTESSQILYQTLVATIIFLKSQMQPHEVLATHNVHDQMHVAMQPYFLDQIFGISKQTLLAVNEIIEIVLQHRGEGYIDHTLSSSQLDKMELELYLSMPSVSSKVQVNTESDLVCHYHYLFYFAALVYFKRTLRHMAVDEVQPLIGQALDHIEALMSCTFQPFSPFVWPVAIICFEAKDPHHQRRAFNWLQFITEKSTLSIWKKAKSLIRTLWEKRKNTAYEDLHWDVFLNDCFPLGMMMV